MLRSDTGCRLSTVCGLGPRYEITSVLPMVSDDLAFVAIAIRVGPGRDAPTKTSFIEAVLDAAESQLDTESGPLAIAWSIELNEIDVNFRINRNHVRTRLAERAATAQEAPTHG